MNKISEELFNLGSCIWHIDTDLEVDEPINFQSYSVFYNSFWAVFFARFLT